MAYAALLSLTQTLEKILLFRDKELMIKSLQQKLGIFISFLEQTNSQKNSDLMEDFEERIRDVVYEAEDVIESHISKKILSKSQASTEDSKLIADSEESIRDATYETKSTSSFWNRARYVLCMCQNSEENHEKDLEKRINEKDLEEKNDEERLKNIMEKLDSMWEEVEKMKDNNNNIEALQIEDPLTRATTPAKVESTSEIEEVAKKQPRNSSSSKSAPTNTSAPIVGFEDDTLRIKELLVGSSVKLEAIIIIGMGGIGKTTLARTIYNGSFVSDRFDVRAWTTVSQTYNVVALLANLLKSMGELIEEMNMEKLKLKLYKSLKQKRYLIVMDDVWDTDFLQEFRNIFWDDKNGSRIIMTSRLSEVGDSNNFNSHIHRMNFLSPKESWNLLCQKALGEKPCPLELEEIGRKIVGKCKGLPLAITVIGGVLFKGKKTREYWKYVEKNLKSSKTGNYDDLMEKLSWSYNHLPNHLKACFLYMAVYPEDYVIHISHLMRLWLAEGFLKPIPPQKLEEVAKAYLEDLISRNMIMVHQRSYYGEIKTCTMHDLMRDLCTRKAMEQMFVCVVNNNDPKAVQNLRCLSFHYSPNYLHNCGPTVRSLLFFTLTFGCLENIHSPLLRVLDASNIRFKEFPTPILKLVNLRYLALFLDQYVMIPFLISKLFNLQTLIVIRNYWRYGGIILYLPPEMFQMPWLRHLLVDGSSFLSCPHGAPMWNLQVLSGLIDFRFTKDAIEKIIDLKTLRIAYRCDSTTKWSFYGMENVVDLHQLENLKFHFTRKFMGDARPQMPPNLSFPPRLNKLTLKGCLISWKQFSVIGLLPNLQVLKLKDIFFENSVWKTNEGEFSELKFLFIESNTLEDWEAEGTVFPRLECLGLRDCWRLKCIPPGIGEIPTLREIVLDYCSEGVVDSANEILKEQLHDFGNESFELHKKFKSSICFHKSYIYPKEAHITDQTFRMHGEASGSWWLT